MTAPQFSQKEEARAITENQVVAAYIARDNVATQKRGKRLLAGMHRWSKVLMLKSAVLFLVLASQLSAGVNVLILEPQTGFDGDGIKAKLQSILSGAGIPGANVVVLRPAMSDQKSLSGWFHTPYNASLNIQPIWSNLRGEDGTVWDYVVILENPEVIEKFPGWYAQGVHDVAQEVSKGSGQAVLLMQWPAATSTTTLEYYREVSYRVGRGSGLPVVPAGLARQAAGASLSVQDSDYVAAASIYSRLWNQNAADSSYNYNDSLATKAFNTVNNNKGVLQYSGAFVSAPTGIHSIKGNQKRELRARHTNQFAGGWNPAEMETGRLISLLSRDNLVVRTTDLNTYDLRFFRGDAASGPDPTNIDLVLPRAIDGHYDTTVPNRPYYQNLVKSDSDFYAPQVATEWLKGGTHLRQFPISLLIAQTAHYPLDTQEVFRVGGDYFAPLSAAYMFTMMTGRCPVPLFDDGTKEYIADRIGYETAWRFSTLHGRAPGFKTWPTEAQRMTVDPSDPATLQAAFAMAPEQNVTVTLSCSSTFVSFTPEVLTFTPANYNRPQSISVRVAQGAPPSQSFDVVLSTSSNDVVYNQLSQSWKFRVNNRPSLPNQEVIAYVDTANEIPLTNADVDGEPLTYSVAQQPGNGKVMIVGSYAIYTPKPGYAGLDSFKLQAKDVSVLSGEVIFNVNVVQPPLYGRNLLLNGGAEYGSLPGYFWISDTGKWIAVKQGYNTVKDIITDRCEEGIYSFKSETVVNGETVELYQDVDVSRYRAAIQRGDQLFKLSAFNTEGGDTASFLVSYLDANGQVLSVYDSGPTESNSYFRLFTQDISPPAGTSTLRVRLRAHDSNGKVGNDVRFDDVRLVALQPAGVSPPTAFAGFDQLIEDLDHGGSEAVHLNGGGSFDHGAITNYAWTENGSLIATGERAVVEMALGVHLITLTVTYDDGATATDDLVVEVVGSNHAPSVDAGPDQLNVAMGTTPVEIARVTQGLLVEWDASKDNSLNNTWSSSAGTTSRLWTFTNGVQNRVPVNDARFNKLTHAFSFPAAQATAGGGMLRGVATGQDTFEFVIDFDGANGHIFSPGGNGFDIRVTDRALRARMTDATVYHHLPIEPSGYTHIVLVWNRSSQLLQLYVDGELVDAKPCSATSWGGSTASLGTDFEGAIALMRVYTNHAFSPEEVRANYESLISAPRVLVDLDGSVSDADDQVPVTNWSVVSAPGPVLIDDASAIDTTVTICQPGDYVLRLSAYDGVDTKTDDVVIRVGGTSGNLFNAWISSYAVGGRTGLYQDPEGDGSSNMLEFAFGTDPTKPDSGSLNVNGSRHGLPIMVRDGAEAGGFALYFVRRKDHGQSGSLKYTACFSDDLTEFYVSMAGLVVVASSSVDDDYQVVKVPFPTNLPSGNPARFGYIRVESAP